jgi:hypothetical protein
MRDEFHQRVAIDQSDFLASGPRQGGVREPAARHQPTLREALALDVRVQLLDRTVVHSPNQPVLALDDHSLLAAFGNEVDAGVGLESAPLFDGVTLSAEHFTYEDLEVAPALSPECRNIACVVNRCRPVSATFASNQDKRKPKNRSDEQSDPNIARAVERGNAYI